jgi:glycosyltransferase involved in cell wall biosynthesis
MKIMFSKFSNWDLESYWNKHPETIAIKNIIKKNSGNTFILVGDGSKYEHFYYDGLHFYNFNFNNKFQYALSSLVKAELFLFQRPNVIVSMGIINSLPFGLLSIFTRSRFIPLITGEIWYSMETLPNALKKVHRILLKLMFNRANKILVLSESIAKELVADYSIDSKKISVTKYKVSDIFNTSVSKELKRELNPTGGPIILTLCRISSVKGLEYLVGAAKDIIAKFPTAKIIIKGFTSEEDYKQKIEQLIKTSNLDQSVIMMEGSPNVEVAKYMVAADVFVLPSLSEGLGVVILEALSCGLPVIATNVGGVVDIVKPGYNGLLVNPRDSEALSDTIIKVLSDNVLRERLIAGGLETTKRLNENSGLEQDIARNIFSH